MGYQHCCVLGQGGLDKQFVTSSTENFPGLFRSHSVIFKKLLKKNILVEEGNSQPCRQLLPQRGFAAGRQSGQHDK